MSLQPGQEPGRVGRTVALLTTHLIKIGGLLAAMNELFLRPSVRASVVALAAFMMAGAQLSEHAVLAAIDRLLGSSEDERRELKP